jgi:hypothetical protein
MFELEPDEDEDPNRVCVKCGVRPRWSRHGNCRFCVDCNPDSVVHCVKLRKEDAPLPNTATRSGQRQVRYRALRKAGATCEFALLHRCGERSYQRGMQHLALTSRKPSVSIPTTLPEAKTSGGRPEPR